jgi:hypothetical protein
MKLCGWKTRDMFDLIRVVDQAHLARLRAPIQHPPERHAKYQQSTRLEGVEVR